MRIYCKKCGGILKIIKKNKDIAVKPCQKCLKKVIAGSFTIGTYDYYNGFSIGYDYGSNYGYDIGYDDGFFDGSDRFLL